jgi:Flp pilus assembly secretin CpaC
MSPNRKLRAASRWTAGMLASALVSLPAWAAGFQVEINQSKLHRINGEAATVIVGNPSIANVSVGTPNTLVVFGRSYGSTNLIALDENGRTLSSIDIDVVAPRHGNLTVTKGTGQLAYNCSPRCERVINPTDTPEEVNALITATQSATDYADATAQSSGE